MFGGFLLLYSNDFIFWMGSSQLGMRSPRGRILCLEGILSGRMSSLITLSLCTSNGSMGCLSTVITSQGLNVIARLLSCPSARKLSILPHSRVNCINKVLSIVMNMTKGLIFIAGEAHSIRNFIILLSWINGNVGTPYSSYLCLD